MFELLTLFLTGGGSAAMGSILKGVGRNGVYS